MTKALIEPETHLSNPLHVGVNSRILLLIRKKSFFLQKRSILLLEVMIAIALIVLAAIPLIYPHVYLLRAQRHFLEKIELDHAVNLHFVNLMEQLYLNKISWAAVVNEEEFSFSNDTFREMGYKSPFPFQGSYRFKVEKHKPKGESESTLTLYLLDLDYSFHLKKQPSNSDYRLNYHYNLFVVRDLDGGFLPEGSAEDENQEQDGRAGQ